MYDAVVIGLGASGFATVCYLVNQGLHVAVTDNRESPPLLPRLQSKFPELAIYLGEYDESILGKARKIVMSPGICPHEPEIVQIRKKYYDIIYSDIDLFLEVYKKPIVAVTGSNGKSTVIKMIHDMVIEKGSSCTMIGNVGVPVLDFLEKTSQSSPDWVVLEISSFQLYWTKNMRADYAVVINIFPNHLDWHTNFDEYCRLKLGMLDKAQFGFISESCAHLLEDKSDINNANIEVIKTGHVEEVDMVPAANQESFLPKNLKENAVVAQAIAEKIGIDNKAIKKALAEFQPWPFRCELQYHQYGYWYNDAKSTNLAAAEHALTNISAKHRRKVIWLCGGIAKKESFADMPSWVSRYVCHAIVYGKDASLFVNAIMGSSQVSPVKNLHEAVKLAKDIVQQEDVVVFSPAAASFDQFKNFQHRGQCFNELVSELVEV